ncbi:MAG: nuclear transport factor 2 family protein [Chloroflexi bacterium]|nr:nuclear transport factor 2 family protein [Chloroflexota bacterium]
MGPEDLGRFFIDRANAGDVDGLVALYERDAVLLAASGEVASGPGSIRLVLEAMVSGMAAQGTIFSGTPPPAVSRGDLALTYTRFTASHTSADGRRATRKRITAEVARRQPDGTRLLAIGQPHILG